MASYCFPYSAELEQEEETAGEKLQGAFKKVGDKLSEWGILSPRLMLAGGGLFMTLANWGLLPAVRYPISADNAEVYVAVCWMRSVLLVTSGAVKSSLTQPFSTLPPKHPVETGCIYILEAMTKISVSAGGCAAAGTLQCGVAAQRARAPGTCVCGACDYP